MVVFREHPRAAISGGLVVPRLAGGVTTPFIASNQMEKDKDLKP